MKDKTSAEQVQGSFNGRMDDIRKLWKAKDNTLPDIGSLNEYGLGIDLVEAGTFEGQREDYIRYRLCWGGPSEEFRIYKNGDVEFWRLDWYDGACIDVDGEDAEIIRQIVEPLELWKGGTE